jgi:hypothetical protein
MLPSTTAPQHMADDFGVAMLLRAAVATESGTQEERCDDVWQLCAFAYCGEHVTTA